MNDSTDTIGVLKLTYIGLIGYGMNDSTDTIGVLKQSFLNKMFKNVKILPIQLEY